MVNKLPTWLIQTPIAHRGLHGNGIPENSLGAFAAATSKGYAFELDIRCTKDNQLVVIHDDSTKAMTGTDIKVTDSSADVLQNLRLCETNYHIPLLSEVFKLTKGKVPILIEVKTGTPAHRVCPLIVELLTEYDGKVAVQSFDPFIINWFRVNAPQVARGQLSSSFKNEPISILKKLILQSMVFNIKTRPQFIAYNIVDMPSKIVGYWCKILQIPLLLWTIKTQDDCKTAKKTGANIIFENLLP